MIGLQINLQLLTVSTKEGAISCTSCKNITLYFFLQIFSAIEYMHSEHYVHRDIKLDNVVVDDRNSTKLTDFGTALRGLF